MHLSSHEEPSGQAEQRESAATEMPDGLPNNSENRWHQRGSVIGPVAQFALLLAPIVMSCFFSIYALTGLMLEGRDRLNWSLEAREVALWMSSGIVLFGLLVMAFVRFRLYLLIRIREKSLVTPFWRQPLVVSSLVHILIALVMTMIVFRVT